MPSKKREERKKARDLLTPEERAERRQVRVKKTVKAFTVMGRVVRFFVRI